MKSRALLRLVLLSLVTSLSVLAFHVAEHPGAAHAARQERSDDAPGSLTALDSKGNVAGPCPLRRTEVRAEVSGFLSRVTVTQDFHNPFEDKIEAVYTFPLPQGAAVDDMTMLVGGRTVKGKIMRREEAKATYEQAKQRGHVASLLAQQRPNVFTQSVANILPGEGVKVIISYVETLKYEGGSYEWSFPVVVGKRYMPAPAKPEGKGNAGETPAESSASSDDASGETEAAPSNSEDEQLNPPVVPEGMRAGHDISIEVALDAGVPVESISSETHEIEEERQDAGRAVVRLKNRSVIPNKDFVLRYDVAGRQITDALLAHRSARGGFFTFILQPPERVSAAEATPKELVFVLDTSGSMSGFPIEKAKETMKLALEGLHPHDTFNLITFSGDTHVLFPEPVPATPQNLDRAQRFLASRRGDGGTEMMKAIRAALDPSDSQAHVRVAVFMTDGQVGNDMEIIAEVRRHANARVFAMGFGSSPNRFLLDQMAAHGRGEVEYVTEGSDSASAARRFHERVRDPLLTDISIEWAGLPVADVYPRRTPDLFGAKPVYLSGRYTAGARGTITLRGRMAGREFSREIPVVLPEREDGRDVLATLWARRRIDELSAEEWAAAYSSGKRSEEMKKAVVNEVTQLGLDFRLMTQYTSFVAVEDGSITGGDAPRRVDVPVENTTSYAVGGAHTNGVSEYVVVTSTAEVLDSSTASLSRTVESRTVDNLPLNGRSPLGFAVLAPGVTRAGATRPRQDAPNNFSAYGQGPESNLFTVDGVSANVGIAPGGESPGPTAAGTIPALTAAGNNNALASLHTTRELTVRGFFVEPEHGRVPGLRVALNTSSGTNEFRGSLFEYFGHERTDANDFFANSRGLPRPRRSLNNFGGILGGPLKRDSTFFFASYEGLRLRQPDLALTQVPTLAARLAAPPNVRPFLEAFPLPTGAEGADGFAE
ncbi:MAG TPA: VIT and VWA domain-containing protein, partial [Pyrinomonadaceae bacterium]|nr:VIT and VWA domain-containing protein [Pyrinomonadaceae bacterium]